MAEYIIVPDSEIEPGKPGTSLLFHKLRDNPEAVREGAASAPRIQPGALAVATGAFTFAVGANIEYVAPVAVPGGSWNRTIGYQNSGSAIGQFRHITYCYADGNSYPTNGVYLFGVKGASAVLNCTSYFFAATAALRTPAWGFLRRDKTPDPLTDLPWIAQVHCAYGQPFGDLPDFPVPYDPALHDIYSFNPSQDQYIQAQRAMFPVIGGGWLTPAVYQAREFTIDYTAQERGFFESFFDLFSVNYGTPETWPADPITIAPNNLLVGDPQPILAALAKPADLNHVTISVN